MKDYSKLTDEELIASGESFDDIAAEIMLRYRETVKIKAATFTSKKDEFDDLFQEGMIGLFFSIGKYKKDKGASFKTFATVCIENRIKNAYKKMMKNRLDNNEDVDVIKEDSGTAENPEDIFISSENLENMTAKMRDRLSSLEYEVFEMTMDGYTYEQIAKRKSITLKAVDNALQRARRKLKSIFK